MKFSERLRFYPVSVKSLQQHEAQSTQAKQHVLYMNEEISDQVDFGLHDARFNNYDFSRSKRCSLGLSVLIVCSSHTFSITSKKSDEVKRLLEDRKNFLKSSAEE